MIRRTRSSSGSPACARSWRSSSASSANRCRASVGVGAGRRGRRARRRARRPRSGRRRRPPRSSSSPSARRRSRPRGSAPGQRRAARRPSSARSRGPIAQRGPVSRVSSVGVGGQVVQQGERGDHLGDLGQPQQPLEADDLDRDLAPRSARRRRRRRGRCRGSARRSRATTGSAIAGVGARRPGRRARPARRRTSRARRPATVARRPRRGFGSQRPHLRGLARRAAAARCVGGLEDARVGAPVDGERVRRDVGRRRRAGKSCAEPEDVGHRRAPPAVDRLVGVADRGHRVAAAVAGVGPGEEPAQHQRLGDRGVLVLVEQHDLELRALGLADLGAARAPAGRRARSGRRSPSARGGA